MKKTNKPTRRAKAARRAKSAIGGIKKARAFRRKHLKIARFPGRLGF